VGAAGGIGRWHQLSARCKLTYKTYKRISGALYRDYRAWAEEAGHRVPPKNSFGRALRGQLPALKTTGVGAKRDYVGVALGDYGQDQFAALMEEKGQRTRLRQSRNVGCSFWKKFGPRTRTAITIAWSQCDATWQHRTRLLQAMNAAKPALAFLELSQRQFFYTLPSQVPVFCGCSASRVPAIAWTTSRAVAEGFARGHRGTPVPEPVVASAIISKEHIFFVTDERAEKEIVLNPRRLREILVEPFAALR
jgi:hypothetical protein